MSKCPYTWFKSVFGGASSKVAQHLRVTVKRDSEVVVDVSLPARSAGWLIDLIPDDVVEKIKAEGIPIEDIQADLASRTELCTQQIFTLTEDAREVTVWLE